MPHFVIHCNEGLLKLKPAQEIMRGIYDVASSTGLFAKSGPGGIKVRISPFEHYLTLGSQDSFIHVFGNIMEGRTEDQKKALSSKIVQYLKTSFPDEPIISMNVQEFERATYCNKSMVE